MTVTQCCFLPERRQCRPSPQCNCNSWFTADWHIAALREKGVRTHEKTCFCWRHARRARKLLCGRDDANSHPVHSVLAFSGIAIRTSGPRPLSSSASAYWFLASPCRLLICREQMRETEDPRRGGFRNRTRLN